MTSVSSCLTLIKHNELAPAFAHIYLLSPRGSVQQLITNGASIRFNKFSKLAGIAWPAADELVFLRTGTFKVEFSLNYGNNNNNAQVALYLNNVPMIGAFGTSSPLITGVGRLSGTYVLRFNINDRIKLVGISNPFTIKSAGPHDEIIATLIVTEE